MTEHNLTQLLVGDSIIIRQIRDLIIKIAPSTLPVLVQGPTGSGKELVAQALHRASGRSGQFVPSNVCAITETMFEDTLFGHVRGAFTGAHTTTPGLLLEANHGTLFLDEISGLPLAMQAKLLRAIETKQFRPVGATTDRRSEFRLVTASNEDLNTLIQLGRFRSDLAQRLRGIVIVLPPLAERLDDIPALAHHFVQDIAKGDKNTALTPGALRTLQRHTWPGNVRELRHTIERAVALSGRTVLRQKEIRAALCWSGERTTMASGATNANLRQFVNLLEDVRWNTTAAAEKLGVNRVTVYRRMNRFGIVPPDPAFRRPEGTNMRDNYLL